MEYSMINHHPCYHGHFTHGSIQQNHMWLREEGANTHRTRPHSSFLRNTFPMSCLFIKHYHRYIQDLLKNTGNFISLFSALK
jgi:hypothetical protein